MPYTSSISKACPIWEPQLRTPGMVRNSWQAAVEMRTISGCDVPGLVSQCIRKSRSLNEGSSSRPSKGQMMMPAARSAAMTP